MTVFADSSAVVKLYVDEPSTEGATPLKTAVVAGICRVEVPAAIWRKARTGAITERDASLLVREFELDLAGLPGGTTRFVVMPTSGRILTDAATVAQVHGLRSLDAIQLASALAAREADQECLEFACIDRQLGRAALALGFQLNH